MSHSFCAGALWLALLLIQPASASVQPLTSCATAPAALVRLDDTDPEVEFALLLWVQWEWLLRL